jgi:prepilin signal peptidase PulO-like enzyme (type II secretory pathway)
MRENFARISAFSATGFAGSIASIVLFLDSTTFPSFQHCGGTAMPIGMCATVPLFLITTFTGAHPSFRSTRSSRYNAVVAMFFVLFYYVLLSDFGHKCITIIGCFSRFSHAFFPKTYQNFPKLFFFSPGVNHCKSFILKHIRHL